MHQLAGLEPGPTLLFSIWNSINTTFHHSLPSNLAEMSHSKRHHHRTYSWPPCLQLLDVAAIRLPLPDIDDDPFAHFVSPPADDDDPASDVLAFSAGIVAPSSSSSAKAKAYKFRTSIARKWAKYIARHYVLDHHKQHKKESETIHVSRQELLDTLDTVPLPKYDRTFSQSQELLSESHARRRDKRSNHVHNPHHHRHSWHAPPAELFTIQEETIMEEDTESVVDEHIVMSRSEIAVDRQDDGRL